MESMRLKVVRAAEAALLSRCRRQSESPSSRRGYLEPFVLFFRLLILDVALDGFLVHRANGRAEVAKSLKAHRLKGGGLKPGDVS